MALVHLVGGLDRPVLGGDGVIVVHVTNEMEANGTGITNMVVDLAVEQAAAGHDVFVVSSGGSFVELLEENGVVHVLAEHSRRRIYRHARALGRIVRLTRPTVVHAHTMTAACAITLLRVLRVVRRPLVTTVHNEFQGSSWLMGLADAVVAVSRPVAEGLARQGVPAERLRVVVNRTRGTVRQRGGAEVACHHPAVLFVGGFSPRKGLDVLLEAFETVAARVPDVHLYVVGNRDNPDIEQRVQASDHAGRIHMVGFVSNPRPWFLATDVLVVPSRRDPAPLVVPEARDVGLPIVASDVDGIPQLLDGGEAGRLVPPGDPAALADALVGLLTSPGSLRALRAASLTSDGGDTATMGRDYEVVYEQVRTRFQGARRSGPSRHRPGSAERPVPTGPRTGIPEAHAGSSFTARSRRAFLTAASWVVGPR
ncbi:glycosyltransferase family 4 protein [Geodermatophilus sp. SYSU D01119]